MTHSLLIEVTEVPRGAWSERKLSLLYHRAHRAHWRQLWRSQAQERGRWGSEPQFLICKESLNDFPLKVARLIRKAYGPVRNLNCAITVGITMSQCCQLCREPGSLSLPSTAATITAVEKKKVHGLMMSLCRFWTKTDKLLLPLFFKQILEISCCSPWKRSRWEWFGVIAWKFDILFESKSACYPHNVGPQHVTHLWTTAWNSVFFL